MNHVRSPVSTLTAMLQSQTACTLQLRCTPTASCNPQSSFQDPPATFNASKAYIPYEPLPHLSVPGCKHALLQLVINHKGEAAVDLGACGQMQSRAIAVNWLCSRLHPTCIHTHAVKAADSTRATGCLQSQVTAAAVGLSLVLGWVSGAGLTFQQGMHVHCCLHTVWRTTTNHQELGCAPAGAASTVHRCQHTVRQLSMTCCLQETAAAAYC